MLVQDFIQNGARIHPNKTALVCGPARFTYAQLDAMANRLANAFHKFGVARGDRIAIYLNNCVEGVVGIFAAAKADAVFIHLNRTTKSDTLVSILNNCQARIILLDKRAVTQRLPERILKEVGSLREVIVCRDAASSEKSRPEEHMDFELIQRTSSAERPDSHNIDLDLACLIYTSGTTGESKGVMCDHNNITFVTHSITTYLNNTDNDVVMNVLPLSFSYGLYQLLAMFYIGGTLVLEESFAFPDFVLEKMAQEKVTGFAGVPTIYSMLLNMDIHNWDLSSLKYLTNAAAGLPVEHVKRLRQTLPKAKLYLMYGLTEAARAMYLPPVQSDIRPASSGIAIPGTELWIEDENGFRLGPGEVGELIVRGRNVMRGYWEAPELTAARFRAASLPGERVCLSGDLFKMDEQGYYYFVSRKDDMIKTRGEKVAPREVEQVLYAIPGVQDAAVVAIPDPLIGNAIKAFIVARDVVLTAAEVISLCKARLEDFKVPRDVEFRDELPKTSSGKVRRMDLR
ncbi:MAG: AMP-dependent synthetase [Acidobacteria bacterium]|nr:MAG: AMP-dependent synthetase [Acidobacteriota bacterium]